MFCTLLTSRVYCTNLAHYTASLVVTHRFATARNTTEKNSVAVTQPRDYTCMSETSNIFEKWVVSPFLAF